MELDRPVPGRPLQVHRDKQDGGHTGGTGHQDGGDLATEEARCEGVW